MIPTSRSTYVVPAVCVNDLTYDSLDMGMPRARPHCRVVLPRIPVIPESLAYSVPLFLKRQCDRTLGMPWRTSMAPDTCPEPCVKQVRRHRNPYISL
jgi:hypothetical protein